MGVTTRTSSAQWQGDLKSGNGELALGSGAFTGSYSFASRFEEDEGTNPEELIAAAHAACFSMSLANLLAKDGKPADSVRTEATVHLDRVEGAPTITRIELSTVGRVPGIDEIAFRETAEVAKAGCIVSRLVAAAEIELDATLET
ncbi:MAG: OsmC family protein [Nitriliruptoraceae bacterium]